MNIFVPTKNSRTRAGLTGYSVRINPKTNVVTLSELVRNRMGISSNDYVALGYSPDYPRGFMLFKTDKKQGYKVNENGTVKLSTLTSFLTFYDRNDIQETWHMELEPVSVVEDTVYFMFTEINSESEPLQTADEQIEIQ